MEIKTTLRFLLIFVRMAIIKKANDNKCWQGCGGKESSYTVGVNVNCTTTIEISIEVNQKTKNISTCIILGHISKEYKSTYR
jgi:hypothetical protein